VWEDLIITLVPGVSRRTLLQMAMEAAQITLLPEPNRGLITTVAKADEINITAIYDVRHVPSAELPGKLASLLPHGLFRSHNGQDHSELGATGLVVIRDTGRIHAETVALLDLLRTGERTEPPAERVTCLYAVPDAQTLADLQRLLPKLVAGPDVTWPEGSVETLGLALVVNQTEAVHRRIETIVEAIHAGGRRPPVTSPQPYDKK
jgi:hypothetical protein